MESAQVKDKRSKIRLAPDARIKGYHAHLYYNESSIEIARHVRLLAKETFPAVELGHLHLKPIGPHPVWSTEISFEPYLFEWFLDCFRNCLFPHS